MGGIVFIAIAILGVGASLSACWSNAISADYSRILRWRPTGLVGSVLLLALLIPVVAVGVIYLAVRGRSRSGARPGGDRPAAACQGRHPHARGDASVALCVVAVAVLTGSPWIVLVPSSSRHRGVMAADGGPILAVPLALTCRRSSAHRADPVRDPVPRLPGRRAANATATGRRRRVAAGLGNARLRGPAPRRLGLLGVRALRVQLDPDEPELVGGRFGRRREVAGNLSCQPIESRTPRASCPDGGSRGASLRSRRSGRCPGR